MNTPSSRSVLFTLASFESGGSEWFALRLAQGLAKEGFTPLFLAAQKKGELREAIENEFDTTSLSATAYSFLSFLCTLPATIRFLRQRRPDTVISGLPLPNFLIALAVKLSLTRPRLIMIEHMRLCPGGVLPRTLKQKIKIALLGLTYPLADKVIAVSKTAANDLARLHLVPPEKISIIPNPVIPENSDALCQERPDHPWLAQKDIPVLVAVGRLLEVKDYPTLLNAFALARKEQELRLVIFGEGKERPRIEALINELGLQNDVALAGATDKAFAAMRAADLFVLSSTSEAFGTVVAEALACGTPVVSTDCGGPREILEDGKWGTLVPVRDPRAMARAILENLEKPHDRDALKARGRFYSVEKAVSLYSELLR